jgi:hypothetical protein
LLPIVEEHVPKFAEGSEVRAAVAKRGVGDNDRQSARLGNPITEHTAMQASGTTGTQEKVLAHAANMPGIWGIPDMNRRVSAAVRTAALDPKLTLRVRHSNCQSALYEASDIVILPL